MGIVSPVATFVNKQADLGPTMQPQTLFTNYIIAGITALLARVRAAAYIVPEADRQQAWHLLSFGLKLDDAWPVTRDLLLALAPKMELAGFREEWIPYLVKGIQCAQKVGDDLVAAECELQIGMLYRLMSRLEEAEHWTTASVKRFVEHMDAQGQARAFNELAWLEQLQRRYAEATCHVEQALAILNELDPERAMCYRVQGMIAIGQGRFQDAERYHRKALAGFEAQKDYRKTAWGLQNIAYTLREIKDFEQAIPLYQKAEVILKEINDSYHWAVVNLNLGITLYHAGKSENALVPYNNAQNVFSRMQNKLSLAHTHSNLGLCYIAQQQYELAENAFQTAMTIFAEIHEQGWLVNSMDGLAMTYIATKQYQKAISVLEQACKMLPAIAETLNYKYLCDSLAEHWQIAYKGQTSL